MEVCNCHTRNMSFLDEIFGTDGRKHKDEGIWNWVKNQRIKRKLKKAAAEQQQQQQQQQQSALHLHSTPAANNDTFSSAPTTTATEGHTHNPHYHHHHHPESTHTRSYSISSAASTSHQTFYCSPRSPTSTFTPSTTTSSSPRDSLYYRRPASVNSSTTTAVGSTHGDVSASIPKAHRLPYTHSRQRAQSTFTLPASMTMAMESSTPKRSVSSRQQRSQYTSNDYHQYHNLHSHHTHGFYDDDEGPIRRSASSRSAPTYYYSQSPPQSQYQSLRQQYLSQHPQYSQEEDYANLCDDIDSLSISGHSSSYNSSSGSSNSSSSNKGKGVQRDQEQTIDEITEVDDEYSDIAADSNMSPSVATHNSFTMLNDGHSSDSSSTVLARQRGRSESTHSLHYKKEDGWWWE